jgi:hypothetical protein
MEENKGVPGESGLPVEEALKTAENARNMAQEKRCPNCGEVASLHSIWQGDLVCPAPAISLPPVTVEAFTPGLRREVNGARKLPPAPWPPAPAPARKAYTDPHLRELADDEIPEALRDLHDFMIKLSGRPLADLGLDGAVIVDAQGNDVGPLMGFAVEEGESMRDAILRTIGDGNSLVIRRAS